MFNTPTKAQLANIPPLYSTDRVPTRNKIIHAHFFLGDCDWFIAEIREDLMFGFCILNGDYEMAEWGLVSLEELMSIKTIDGLEVEFDTHWVPRPAREVELIRRATHYA
jgi:hypothetical protein